MTSTKPPPPPSDPKQPPQLQIQVDEALAQGAYVNFTLVNHTETEFVFDFVYIQPMDPRAKVRARIISSPKHAKRLAAVLADNIAKYEQRFGAIEAQKSGDPPVH